MESHDPGEKPVKESHSSENENKIQVVINALSKRRDELIEKGSPFEIILIKLQELLTKSDNGYFQGYLKDALLLLQILPVKESSGIHSIFSTTLGKSMGINTNKEELQRIKNSYKEIIPSAAFMGKQLEELITIYNQILGVLKKEPKWSRIYEKNDAGEITNGSIKKWQNGGTLQTDKNLSTSPLPFTKAKAIGDFQRDVKIEGQSYRNQSEETVRDALEELAKKVASSPEEINSIVNWLLMNGGQESNDFYKRIIATGDTQDKVKYVEVDEHAEDPRVFVGWSTGAAKNQVTNWYVQDNKIYCDYVVNINTLMYSDPSSQKIIYINGEGKDIFIDEIMEVGNAMGEVNTLNKSNNLSPIMTVNARIELNVDRQPGNTIIKPKLDKLQIVSYTDKFQLPEEPKLGVAYKR